MTETAGSLRLPRLLQIFSRSRELLIGIYIQSLVADAVVGK